MTILVPRTVFTNQSCNLSLSESFKHIKEHHHTFGEGIMKNLLSIALILCSSTAIAFADEWQGLSEQEQARVKLQTREMSALGVPEIPAQDMLRQMIRNRFQEQNMIRARQLVNDAGKAGLPAEPLMNKAMEGMVKQVGEQQILAAMATVRNRYAYADQMARSLSTDQKSITSIRNTIADSLAAGMQPGDVEAITAQLQTRTRQQSRISGEDDQLRLQTMQTMRTMARLRADPTVIVDTLNLALQNAYTHMEMHQLRRQITTSTSQESIQQIANRHMESLGKNNNFGNDQEKGSGDSGSGGSSSGSGSGGSGSGGSGSSGSSSGGSSSGGSSSGGSSSGGSSSGGSSSGGSSSGGSSSGGSSSGGSSSGGSSSGGSSSGGSGSDSGGGSGGGQSSSGNGGCGSGVRS